MSPPEVAPGSPWLPYYDVVTPWTVEAGLCDTCRWRRDVRGAASTFVLCTRGLTDPAFAKYPALPVRRCGGHDLEVQDRERDGT